MFMVVNNNILFFVCCKKFRSIKIFPNYFVLCKKPKYKKLISCFLSMYVQKNLFEILISEFFFHYVTLILRFLTFWYPFYTTQVYVLVSPFGDFPSPLGGGLLCARYDDFKVYGKKIYIKSSCSLVFCHHFLYYMLPEIVLPKHGILRFKLTKIL